MAFLRAIASAFVNYFNFRGRANRREFWYWLGFVILAWLLLLYVDLNYMAPLLGYMPMEEGVPDYLSNGWLLVAAIPTLSLIVRRMHDHDEPGWKALTILPLSYWLVAKGNKDPNRYG
jgi:uncharacterized membrane protein YhaH (DUF805 family)